MADEKPFDCVRFMRERRAQISRELAGLTPEEQARWIREEAAKYERGVPAPPADEARKSA